MCRPAQAGDERAVMPVRILDLLQVPAPTGIDSRRRASDRALPRHEHDESLQGFDIPQTCAGRPHDASIDPSPTSCSHKQSGFSATPSPRQPRDGKAFARAFRGRTGQVLDIFLQNGDDAGPSPRRQQGLFKATAEAHPAGRACLPQAQTLVKAGEASLCEVCAELLSDTRHGPAYLPGVCQVRRYSAGGGRHETAQGRMSGAFWYQSALPVQNLGRYVGDYGQDAAFFRTRIVKWDDWVMYSQQTGLLVAWRSGNRRIFLMPQLRRIQRAVRAFLKHRRWLRQARRVFARSVRNSCLTPDMVQLICTNYVK